MSPQRAQTWRRVAALVIVASVAEAAYAAINMLGLQVLVDETLGLAKHLGIIMGAFLLVEALMRSVTGTLSDRWGRKPFLVGAPLLSAAAAVGIVLVGGWATSEAPPSWIYILLAMVLLRGIDGLAAAGLWPTVFASMAESVPAHRRTSALSALTMAYMAGVAVGPKLAGWSNVHSPLAPDKRAAFFVAAALFVLAALLAAVLIPSRRRDGKPAAQPEHGSQPIRLSDLTYAVRRRPDLVVTAMVVFIAVGSLAAVVPLYAKAVFNLDDNQLGSLFPVAAVIVGACSVPIGMLGDRWGRHRSVHCGLGLVTLSILTITCIAAAPALEGLRRPWLLVALASGVGVGFVMGLPAWLAYVTDAGGEGRRAQMIGAVATFEGTGALIGMTLSPYLFAMRTTYPGMLHSPLYLATAALLVGWAVAQYTVRPDRVAREASPDVMPPTSPSPD